MMGKSEFYITDGTKFVKQNIRNQFQLVNNYVIADFWDKYQVAKAVLDNSIPKSWRKSFYVAKLEDGIMSKKSLSQDEKDNVKSEILCDRKETQTYELNLYKNKKDFELDTINTAFDVVKDCLDSSEKELQDLQNRLQFLDYAFEDVKHHHLQENLGTVKAYKRDSLESEIFGERMHIKNKIEIYRKINQHRQSVFEAIKDVCNTFDTIENKKYIPRVFPELFENGVDAITPELLGKIAQNGRISRGTSAK